MPGPIYVTRPFLPPFEQFVAVAREIWETGVLTNAGPLHQRLEERLSRFLKVPSLSLTTNGTLALELALESVQATGEVITTPYSFVATTHAVKRQGLQPVFVDICESNFNIDPVRIEAAITPRTSAIVAVHCYGNPAAVDEIEAIAARHGIRVVYDAAHAFGVTLHGRSVLSWGDVSTLSFHATKCFSTFEGGAVASPLPEIKPLIDRLKNFGIANEVEIPSVGGNAKMSEISAAMGLLQLDHFPESQAQRRAVDARYRQLLDDVPGIRVLEVPDGVEPNHSYFPILVTEAFGTSRDGLYEAMLAGGVHPRRYFYPLLSNLPMYEGEPSASPANLPVANRIARQILCLPIYPGLGSGDIDRIVGLVRGSA